MKLALECPTFLLGDIQPLADFDWILSHLVLQDSEYADFYKNSKRQKVLDNSVNELLEPCSLSDLKKAVDIVKPDLIVPPDYLGNHTETERALDDAIEVFGRDKLLPCIQGRELKHVLECARYIKKLGFRTVAVPYDILSSREDKLGDMADRRLEVISRLLLLFRFKIHLLGMTTLNELEAYRGIDQVKSIDTGVPILFGMNLFKLNESWEFKKDKPTLSQMDQNFTDFVASLGIDQSAENKLSLINWNIAYLRRVLND